METRLRLIQMSYSWRVGGASQISIPKVIDDAEIWKGTVEMGMAV